MKNKNLLYLAGVFICALNKKFVSIDNLKQLKINSETKYIVYYPIRKK